MLAVIIVAGLVLGAVLNLVIVRLPRETRLAGWPRCTRCGRPLAWWQVVPIVGWLLQSGQARCCGRRLHWIFPLVEVLMAATLAILYVQYGLSLSMAYLGTISAFLLVIGAIDYQHRYIYTIVIVAGLVVALVGATVVSNHGLVVALLGAFGAGVVFVVLYGLASIMFPGPGVPFGLGDVYLAVFLGAALGLHNIAPALLFGILLAGLAAVPPVLAKYVLRRSDAAQYLPYGTYLCLGALAYLLIWGL